MLSGVDIAEFDNEIVSISHDAGAGTYEVTGELDLTELGADAAELGEVDMSVSITFPGDVTDHNGTLDGRTVTWTPALGEVNEMHATARDSSGAAMSTWLLVAGAIAAAALLAGLGVYVARRRNAAGGRGEAGEASIPDQPAGV